MAGALGPGSMALAMSGAIAAGLALAIGADGALGTTALLVAVVAELVVFFLAHAYVDAVGERYDHPGYPLTTRVAHGFRHAAMVLLGGLPVLAIFLVERVSGVNADDSSTVALVGLILVLGTYGYLAARRSGASHGASFGECLIVALLGMGILLLKLLLE